MPSSADRILAQLGFAGNLAPVWGVVADGHRVGEATPVFPRLEDDQAA
jgi:methionyl-tRNA synthetase